MQVFFAPAHTRAWKDYPGKRLFCLFPGVTVVDFTVGWHECRLTLACLVKIFSSDKAPPAKLYFVYCEPAQRRMAEKDYQEAFFTPGIWPL